MFQFLAPLKIDSPPTQTNPKILTRNNNKSRCSCTRSSGGREGGSRWYHSNPDKTIRSERFNFNPEDEFLADNDDDEDDGAFGFKNATKNTYNRRNWWSGDNFSDDEDDEFGVLEDSIGGIAWITKVFKAFGWMVPAIVISMLVGTGPNTFFMALALPLAQSALSLVVETLWGRPNGNSKYKPRTKKRPFRRAASNVGTSKEKEPSTAYEASAKKGERNTTNFGGWDELDKQGRTDKVPFMAQSRKPNEQSQPKGKLSRTVRKRDKPLVLRLLIAIFPFLGSWTRLL